MFVPSQHLAERNGNWGFGSKAKSSPISLQGRQNLCNPKGWCYWGIVLPKSTQHIGDDHNPLWRYKYPMKQPLYVYIYICTPFLVHPLSCIVLCLQLRLPFWVFNIPLYICILLYNIHIMIYMYNIYNVYIYIYMFIYIYMYIYIYNCIYSVPNPIVQGLYVIYTHMITHSSYRLVVVDSADAIRHSINYAHPNSWSGTKSASWRQGWNETTLLLQYIMAPVPLLGLPQTSTKSKGGLEHLGTSNSYSSCLFQVFRHMCKGFRADLRKLRPVTSLHHFRDVACNREPRLLAVENLDAPAARTPCVGDQSVSACDDPLCAKCTTQEASASPRSPTAANMKFRSLRSAWTVSIKLIQHEREFKTYQNWFKVIPQHFTKCWNHLHYCVLHWIHPSAELSFQLCSSSTWRRASGLRRAAASKNDLSCQNSWTELAASDASDLQ